MLPLIGTMIGFYIFTRMASFLARTGDQTEHWVVKVLAVITMAVTALVVVSLVTSGIASSLNSIS